MKIFPVTHPAFRAYGRVIKGYRLKELDSAMQETECPTDAVVYYPSIKALEELKIYERLTDEVYGGMPIQIGFCNGYNHTLNAVEYHRDSELNYAATDMILLVGLRKDIEDDFSYDTSQMQAFYVKKGTLVEVFATTLHYAPISADQDSTFRVTVVLPKGTNKPLTKKEAGKNPEYKLLTHINKWLIAHPDSGLGSTGAFVGLTGENITI